MAELSLAFSEKHECIQINCALYNLDKRLTITNHTTYSVLFKNTWLELRG